MKDKKIKKKLTLSTTTKRSVDSLQYINTKNKTNVVIEKKIYRKKGDFGFAGKRRESNINKPSFTTNTTPNTGFSKKKLFFNKNAEIRKLAEQKATRRIRGDDTAKTLPKGKIKNTAFGKKREYKLTLSRALTEDESSLKERSLASIKRARLKEKKAIQTDQKQSKQITRNVNIPPDVITIRELANRMAEQASNIIKHLLGMGVTATINHIIDSDTAEYLVKEFGHIPIKEEKKDIKIEKINKSQENFLTSRPPIVTVMGHVDHGKTSLLDALRETNVVSGEHGGITQHIGAYQVLTGKEKSITFIDTPGHAAFTAMRARGSKVTDIVVLVVAADDGVKPQTVEAIKHSKAANVPIVVAINKCDLPGADPQKIKNQLLEYELIAEDLSGETLFAEISAKNKKNLDKLIESINLQAEILDLKANSQDPAKGIVLESRIDKGRGAVSTVLITNGSLKKGDFFVSGSNWGKVRAMLNHAGKNVDNALPSTPVEILGMNGSAHSGDDFNVVETEDRAKEISDYRKENLKPNQNPLIAKAKETVFDNYKKTKELAIILKSDVYGSSEALKNAITNIKHEEVSPKIIISDVGLISETDVSLAKATDAILLGFNVKASKEAKKLAENHKINIKYFSVIYEAIDYIISALSGLLKPNIKEEIVGSAEILEIFKVSKVGKVAGSKVTEGEIRQNSNARLIRDGKILYTGLIGSIFREKNATKQVSAGVECGITLKDFADFKEKDVIEIYKISETERTI